jgi:hypothetical protein
MWAIDYLCIMVAQQWWTKLYDDWKEGAHNGVCSP